MLAIVFAGLLTYRDLFDFYFTDVDTFALISTSRFYDFESFASIFTSPMMKGQLPNALFFRPLASLTWGVDELIWGMNPLGYHLTALVIHLANSVLLFLLVRNIVNARPLARKRPGGKVFWGEIEALIAGLLYVVHPVAVETVAAIARRPDLLFGFFSLLALHATGRYLANTRKRDQFAIALFCVLALASKDSAVVVLALVGTYVLCFGVADDHRARLRLCFRVCVVPFVAVVLYVAGRTLVLGGLGGYETAFDYEFGSVVKTSSLVFVCVAVLPGELDACTPSVAQWVGVGSLILAGLVGSRFGQDWDREARRRFSFALLCSACFFMLFVLTRTVALTRTVYALIPFFCMILSCGLVGTFRFRREVRLSVPVIATGAVRFVSFTLLCGAIVVAAWRGQYLDEWRQAGELTREIVDSIDDSIHDIAPGSTVYTVNLPFKASATRLDLRDHPLLDDYSVQGWVDLAHPLHRLYVVGLTRTRVALDDPAELASKVSWDPDRSRLDVWVGAEASVDAFLPKRRWGRNHPLREVQNERDEAGEQLSIELLAEAFTRPPVVFWVLAGDRVVTKRNEAWTIVHPGNPAS